MGKVLIIGIIFSISTAMVAGGIQHFLDSPWRSAWIIPLGYFISLFAFREKEDISNSFTDTLGRAIFVSGIILLICYPLARTIPEQFDNHHGENTGYGMIQMNQKNNIMGEHCKNMSGMKGCENMHNAGKMGGMDHSMMDHGAMVTSEDSFVINMIPHHQEAVDTARLVLEKGESAELRKLAQAIITAQESEIAMMKKWSKDWNYSAVSSYQNMMGDGTKLSGKELDEWFLEGMIVHHMGAIQMAESLLKLKVRKEVADFAREVIHVQGSEISQMKKILGE